jgi:hypothetical protein
MCTFHPSPDSASLAVRVVPEVLHLPDAAIRIDRLVATRVPAVLSATKADGIQPHNVKVD